MSLADDIKKAQSVKEVQELLTKSKTFKFPSEKTKRRWKENAEIRLAELNSKQ